jgi:DNA repair protein RadC
VSVHPLGPVRPIVLRSPSDAVAWARTLPGFGARPEAVALLLGREHDLRAAAWLGAGVGLPDLALHSRGLLSEAAAVAATAIVLLICRPGRPLRPSPSEAAAFERLGSACERWGVTLLDAVLVGRRRWRSVGEEAA